MIQLYKQTNKKYSIVNRCNQTVKNRNNVNEQWYITDMMEINHAYLTNNRGHQKIILNQILQKNMLYNALK